MEADRRIPSLDAWRALGVLTLFHLAFFGQHLETMARVLAEPGAASWVAGRLADLLFFSGALGADMLFLASGCLVALRFAGARPDQGGAGGGPAPGLTPRAEQTPEHSARRTTPQGQASTLAGPTGAGEAGASWLGPLASRYRSFLPLVLITGLPLLAYGGLSPEGFLANLVLLRPAGLAAPLDRLFGQANPFLPFALLVCLAGPTARALGRVAPADFGMGGWKALAAALALVAGGIGLLSAGGHFLAFFWGLGVGRLARAAGRPPGLPAWTGVVALAAALIACRRFAGLRGEDLFFLLDWSDWRALALLLAFQALLATALFIFLTGSDALRPPALLVRLGRSTNCFFTVFALWTFPLTRSWTQDIDDPLATLALAYAAALAVTTAIALTLAPYLERLDPALFAKPARTGRTPRP